jgi:anaerobic selenocysteine-containing dehydrogenase
VVASVGAEVLRERIRRKARLKGSAARRRLVHGTDKLRHARHALASLEHLVVQDTFMAKTAWLADVVLTRRASVLDAPGLAAGDVISVRSRRGEVALRVRRDDGTPRGAVPTSTRAR